MNAHYSDIGDVLADEGTYNADNVLNADPAFVNLAIDDYHLGPTSPCIDAGTINVPNPPGLPATDIEGNPRVSGAAPDMGAYERTGAPTPPTIGFSPANFSFSATEGGANPANQSFEVWNSGGGTLNWSVGDDAAWLGLAPPNGISTGEHDVVTLFVDIPELTAGGYDATITILAPGATNSPQYAEVTLSVTSAGDQNNPPVATGLASLGTNLVIAWGYKADERWTFYNPLLPEMSTLEILRVGRGYWLNVTLPCTLEYGTKTYPLDEGWNLIGWVGW